MMMVVRFLVVAIAGCGRIAFDPRADGGPPLTGLEAWYRFEEPPPLVVDSSGRNHHGSCASCPAVAPGVVGNAYRFAGTSFVAVPDDGDFSTDTVVTVAGWVFLESAVYQAIVSKPYMTVDANSWQYEVMPPDTACITGLNVTCMPGIAAFGAWQHFAFVFDGTEKRLYLDGVPRMSAPQALMFAPYDVVIGADYRLDASGNIFATGIYLQGLLDELLIYERVLSDQEIQQLALP